MAEATHINSRVSVLESAMKDVRSTIDRSREETRQGFNEIDAQLTKLSEQFGTQGRPTNWYGVIAAAAGTCVIIGSIFALAEWRVGVAAAPSIEAARTSRAIAEKHQEQIIDLRIQHGVLLDRLSRHRTDTATR